MKPEELKDEKQEAGPSLEEAFILLDDITRTLEDEEITLEDSFQAYKKGGKEGNDAERGGRTG